MTSDLNLDAIEQRANAATEGPWEVSNYGTDVRLNDDDPRGMHYICESNPKDDYTFGFGTIQANLNFIAHAREDIPALVKRVRELEAALNKYGEHEANCPAALWSRNDPCNCGLSAARGLADGK